ncbi:MAG: GNAT family N-acetyltransferase [Cytophagales bacterium]|nr:GNAT family N-acetyltransferase [Cytophagales bacterium]
MNIRIFQSETEDLDEILALQEIAYRSEAEIHNDFTIPPLHQTIDGIKTEYRNQLFLKVVEQNKIIASIRAFEENGTCFVGRLIVDPAFQNAGIGTRLVTEVERKFKVTTHPLPNH